MSQTSKTGTGLSINERLRARGLLPDVERIAREHHVTTSDLLGRGRTAMVCRARKALYADLRERGFSYPEIGWLVGRDHTTIMHAIKEAA